MAKIESQVKLFVCEIMKDNDDDDDDWNLVFNHSKGVPQQSDGVSCGYFTARYR